MRTAHQEVKFLRNEAGHLVGISLGYDHCAEHEWGTQGIRRALGVTQGVDLAEAYTKYPEMEKLFPTSIEAFRVSKISKLYCIKGTLVLSKTKTSWFDKKAVTAKKIEFGEAQKLQTGKKTVKWIKTQDFMVFGSYEYESEVPASLEYRAERLIKELKLKEGQVAPSLSDIFTVNETEPGFLEVTVHAAYAEKFYDQLTSGHRVDSPAMVAYRPDTKWGIKDLSSQWCSTRFEFLALGEQACSGLNTIMQAVKSKKAFYGVAPVLNPFSRSGPLLMLEEGITSEEIEAVNNSLIAAKQDALEIYQAFHAVLIELKNNNKNIGQVSIKKRENDEFAVWLNPADSQRYNYGWFTLPDLKLLVEGQGPILKSVAT